MASSKKKENVSITIKLLKIRNLQIAKRLFSLEAFAIEPKRHRHENTDSESGLERFEMFPQLGRKVIYFLLFCSISQSIAHVW